MTANKFITVSELCQWFHAFFNLYKFVLLIIFTARFSNLNTITRDAFNHDSNAAVQKAFSLLLPDEDYHEPWHLAQYQ